MNIREDAIYGRQSVDRKDSISIESQIEFCKYELRGGNFRQYTDKGYSGKNTDRPKFQELIADIKRGLIKRVVVYKLDRISRSILDFATMMETFQAYNVEFVSSTEKFDTSTPMGRAMLNICIVFAQLERETIQKRVTDAYYSRCQRGFHMSGAAPFGFQLEPTTIQGIRTKMMKPDPETADIARLMFEMYAQPSTSFGDIARHFADEGILIYDKELTRGFISQMLRNPIYAQADLDDVRIFQEPGDGGDQRGGGLRGDKRLLSLPGPGRAGTKKQAPERPDPCGGPQRGAGIGGCVAPLPEKADGEYHVPKWA